MKCESLRSLVVCRGFLHDPVVKALMAVQEDERQGDSFSRRAGAAVLLEAAERLGLRGNVLRQYFFYLFWGGTDGCCRCDGTSRPDRHGDDEGPDFRYGVDLSLFTAKGVGLFRCGLPG